MNYDEWLKQLSSKQPSVGLGPDQLEEHPELKALVNLEQDPQAHPEGCVWVHTMLVVDNAAKTKKMVPSEWRVPYLFAALLHDTGKAPMEEPDEHFTGHANYSIGCAAEFLIGIGAPDEVTTHTVNLIRWHHAPFDLKDEGDPQWAVIREQVPLKVLAWFSRCDSFAGARRNQLPVQAVHAPSERTLRIEKSFSDMKGPIPSGQLEERLRHMDVHGVLRAALEEAFQDGRNGGMDPHQAARAKISFDEMHRRVDSFITGITEHVREREALVDTDDFRRRVLLELSDIKTGLKHLNEKTSG